VSSNHTFVGSRKNGPYSLNDVSPANLRRSPLPPRANAIRGVQPETLAFPGSPSRASSAPRPWPHSPPILPLRKSNCRKAVKSKVLSNEGKCTFGHGHGASQLGHPFEEPGRGLAGVQRYLGETTFHRGTIGRRWAPRQDRPRLGCRGTNRGRPTSTLLATELPRTYPRTQLS